MVDPLAQTMSSASAGMRVQSMRLSMVSENLSNADTHGYKRKIMSFEQEFDRQLQMNRVMAGQTSLDFSQGEMSFDPNHPLANGEGYVESSNVEMMIEIADAREAGRSYEANLTTFRQAGDMYRGLLSLLSR